MGVKDSLFSWIDKKTGGYLVKGIAIKNILFNTGTGPNDFTANLKMPSPQDFIQSAKIVNDVQSGLNNLHVGDNFKISFNILNTKIEAFKSGTTDVFKELIYNQKSYYLEYVHIKKCRKNILDFYEKNKDVIEKMKFVDVMNVNGSDQIETKEVKKHMIEVASRKIEYAKKEAKASLLQANKKAKDDIEPLIKKLNDEIKFLKHEIKGLNKKRKSYLESLTTLFGNFDGQKDDDKLWVSIQNKFKAVFREKWSNVENREFGEKYTKEEIMEFEKQYNWLKKNYSVKIEKLISEMENLKKVKNEYDNFSSFRTFKFLKDYCKGEDKKYLPIIEFLEYDIFETGKKCYSFKGEFKKYQDDHNFLHGKYTGKYEYLKTYDSISKKKTEYKSRKKDAKIYASNPELYNKVMSDLNAKIMEFKTFYFELKKVYNGICGQLNLLKEKLEVPFEECNKIGMSVFKEMKKIKEQGLKFSKSEQRIPGYALFAYLSHVTYKLTENNCALTSKTLKFNKVQQIYQNLISLNLEKLNKQDTSIFSKVFSKIKNLI